MFKGLHKKLLKTLNYSTVLIDSIEKLRLVVDGLLSSSEGIFYDLETSECRAWDSGSYPICMSFSSLGEIDTVYVLYLNHEESPFNEDLESVYEVLKPLYVDPNRVICAHNTNFDRAYVETHFGYQITAKVHCTIAMHHLLDITDAHGLAHLAKTYLGIPDLKKEFTEERKRVRDLRYADYVEQCEASLQAKKCMILNCRKVQLKCLL